MAKFKKLNTDKKELRKVGKAAKEATEEKDISVVPDPSPEKEARDEIARENALSRPGEEREFIKRHDRVGKYFKKYLKDFVFDEFQEAYLKKAGLKEIFKGVPIPLREEDLEAFKSEKGLPVTVVAENMTRVLGIDPRFPHAEAYLYYIEKLIGKRGSGFILKEARREAARGLFDDACIHYRAALILDPHEMGAMYGYARACRMLYNSEDVSEEYVGNFKAEALEYFEMLTEIHPKYAQGWYYLGYLYLNMGLYTKANLAWESFLPKSRSRKDIKEIKQRMEQIKMPMEIERGCNEVMAGRWQEGLIILEQFKESVFQDWWPLWYYVGVAYANTAQLDEAEKALKKCLRLNAKHVETMNELIDIYRIRGNEELVAKYKKKIRIVTK